MTSSYPRISNYIALTVLLPRTKQIFFCVEQGSTQHRAGILNCQAHNRSKSSIWPPTPPHQTHTSQTPSQINIIKLSHKIQQGHFKLEPAETSFTEKGDLRHQFAEPRVVVLHLQAKSKMSFSIMLQLAGDQEYISPETKETRIVLGEEHR